MEFSTWISFITDNGSIRTLGPEIGIWNLEPKIRNWEGEGETHLLQSPPPTLTLLLLLLFSYTFFPYVLWARTVLGSSGGGGGLDEGFDKKLFEWNQLVLCLAEGKLPLDKQLHFVRDLWKNIAESLSPASLPPQPKNSRSLPASRVVVVEQQR